MKRFAVIGLFAAVTLLVAALWLWPVSEPGPPERDDSSAGAAALHAARPDERSQPLAGSSFLSGVVRRSGQPVANAHVVVKGAQMFATETQPDGTFEFRSVAPGGVFVSASTSEAASEVIGPLVLEAGKGLRELVIELAPAVMIKGVVLDFVQRSPIAQASVVTAAGAALTDEQGAFSLKGPASQTWLEVSAVGFLPRSEWVALEMARSGSKLEVVLKPASHIEGSVTAGGAPASGATVFVESSRGARRGERSAATVTDARGHFDVECGDGRLLVIAVTREGTRMQSPELVVALGERRTGVMLEANEIDSIGGAVSRDGAPLVGASISVADARSNVVVAGAVSFAGGQFRTAPAIVGSYIVQVRAGDFTGVAGPFEHRLGGAPWVVELKGGAKLGGRVEPAVAGVRVRWRSGALVGPPPETVTDGEGRFSFEGVSAGVITLDAEGAQGAATAKARAGDDVVLMLTHGFVIAHLRDDSGAVLTEGLIFAKSLETGVIRRFMVLAPDGTYRFELPTGRWELELEVSGRGKSQTARPEVTSAGVDVTLSLEAGVIVRGKVIDAQTKLPIAQAMVRARSADVSKDTASVMTNARGEFVTPPIAKSNGLTVSAPGFRQRGDAISNLNVNSALFELTASTEAAPQAPLPFEGIGMTIDFSSGKPVAGSVIEASPAERSGVLRGDVILLVDGAPAGADMNALVGRIRGLSGTPVTITFERAGKPFELVIRRRQISPL